MFSISWYDFTIWRTCPLGAPLLWYVPIKVLGKRRRITNMPIQPVSKTFLWRFVVLTVFILFCFFVYRAGSALYHKHQLRDQFSAAADDSPYQQGIPMEKMDLTAFSSYFPKTFTALGYSLTHRLETPVTLKYYTEIPTDEAAVALEIKKGTAIIAIPERTIGSPLYELGYGYTSYPTYERGWRYVRPFIMAEGSDHADNEQYYYVKMDSLEAVLNKVIELNKPFRADIRQQGWTLNKGKHVIARYVDNTLYQHGAYLSPDLFYRVFDRFNVMLLGAIGIIIAAFLLSRGAWLSSGSKKNVMIDS